MDEKDLELFIKAKKQLPVENIMVLAAALLFVLLTVLHLAGTELESLTITLPMLIFILLLSARRSLWVPVTREHLLNVIERQINRDPEALASLSLMQSGRKRIS